MLNYQRVMNIAPQNYDAFMAQSVTSQSVVTLHPQNGASRMVYPLVI